MILLLYLPLYLQTPHLFVLSDLLLLLYLSHLSDPYLPQNQVILVLLHLLFVLYYPVPQHYPCLLFVLYRLLNLLIQLLLSVP